MGERRDSSSAMTGEATEQFCLRWNDFHSNITSAFSEIRDDDDFLDVTLVCDGDIVRAHKLVLSACSPLFRIMLKKNSHPQPMIFLRGIRFPDMVAILNFMYHGEVNVNQEDLQQFLAAAEELRIKGLSQANTWPEAKSDRNDRNDTSNNTVNTNQVPKKKTNSGGSTHSTGQPPAKRPRPEDKSSPGVSPVSTPVSAKTPEPEEDEALPSHDPPQLSVKPEFSSKEMGLIAAMDEDRENHSNSNHAPNQNNLLDSIAAVQNFAFGQNFEQNAMAPQHSAAYNSPQHLMSGMGAQSQMNNENNQGKGESPSDGHNYGPPGVGGLPYEMHRLGGRTEDGLAHVVVMKTFRGWHCPHCSYISPSQKGNLKVHILNRHANPGESFACMFCGKQLSSRSSLQVHISQVHREQNKAKRMLEERMKISHLEERLKTEMVAGVLGGALPNSPGGTSLSLTNSQLHALVQVPTTHAPSSGPASSSGSLPQSPGRPGAETPPSPGPMPQLEYSSRPAPCFSPDPPEDRYHGRGAVLQHGGASHSQGYSPKPGYTLTRAPEGQAFPDKAIYPSGGGGELTIRRAGPYSPPPARSYSPAPPERSYSPGAPSEAAHVVYPMSPKDFQEGLSSSACQAGSD